MRRIPNDGLLILLLLLGGTTCLRAQSLSADRFLEGVSAHPVGDEVEHNQFLKVGETLNGASPAEIARVLPSVLVHAHSGHDIHERVYATGFLLDIALRPDGAEMLASEDGGVSSLLVDASPVIQRMSVAITDYVIAKPVTPKQLYLAALKGAIQKSSTPQDVAVGVVGPLLFLRSVDSDALKPVLDFLQRNNLDVETRRELVHSLGGDDDLPAEVTQFLVKELSDPDPTVRATALVAFADSTSAFHTQGKPIVERMANDPQEHPEVRELAKQAMAGKTALDPNINLPTGNPKDQ